MPRVMRSVISAPRAAVGIPLILFLNVLCAGAMAGETKAFTYDALGRLVAVQVVEDGGTVRRDSVISYDAAGNRVAYNADGLEGAGTPSNAEPSYKRRYIYNGRFFVQLIIKD